MKIHTVKITDTIITGVIKKIQEKKELINVDEARLKEAIKTQCLRNKKLTIILNTATSFEIIQRSKEVKKLVKDVRAAIRRHYGLFQTKTLVKAPNLIKELEKELRKKKTAKTESDTISKIHTNLLKVHVSTKERLPFYSHFFKDIFAITGNPKTILDLACGFNPMAVTYMDYVPQHYTTVELNKKDVALIRTYFTMLKKIKTTMNKTTKNYQKFIFQTIHGNLEKKETIRKCATKTYDVCFALKLFDLLDNKTTEHIVKNLKYKWLVASFSTKTITKAPMRFKRRAGFQKMLRRLKLPYQTITFPNEMVYILKKQ